MTILEGILLGLAYCVIAIAAAAIAIRTGISENHSYEAGFLGAIWPLALVAAIPLLIAWVASKIEPGGDK